MDTDPRLHQRLAEVVGAPHVLADLESSDTCAPDASNRRASPADAQAERDFARFIAHIRQEESENHDEPWDPWR